MDIVVALIGLAIVMIVAACVAQPFVARTRVKVSVEESPRDKLLAERAALYTTIRDLDFDFQTGKLLEADYRAMREKYMARGVEILKELDALPELRREPGAGGRKPEAAEEIEAAVRAKRGTRMQPHPVEDDIEAAIRSRRKSAVRHQPSAINILKCPSCDRPVDPTDRFCAKCGAALTVEAAR
jgi:hypothetical protein